MTHRIKTYNAISPIGLNRFPDDYEVGADVATADGIVLRSANLHDEPLEDSVLAVARAGAGTNNVPVADLSARGIVVFNTPGANANAVKELVIAGMLLAARNLYPAAAFTAGLSAAEGDINGTVEKAKKQFAGFELPGRTLGVIGLGAIGVLVANAAASMGMKVLGFDPALSVERAWQLNPSIEQASSIDDVFLRADMITVHVPLIDATKGLVNAERLAMLKPEGVVLNFARGGIVDDEAVVAALDADKLHAYVCDFPTQTLAGHKKILALPHLGASTAEAEENCAVMAADQLRDYLTDGTIRNSVNFPKASLARTPARRVLRSSTPTCQTWSARFRRRWPMQV
ncbi:3-phosphoglycerate dehydrogenase [Ornithinimicrobium sp. INDO-MA30-4]|uniref:3-phosphoglycerate dehydrogenase n=1 Tax=Ornithinimicrobium sp. INDO-MA30-4 TaxID=2908651 RepID=UPI001F3D06B5|nr:3-phosphoglycerate dehydrogenase [Ornithinimicrobium sp. INDO-MA30-4]UJH70860.1 3-phosphoglycerate dehydrogenase [Ornithinimicrobium sp. INDO-MA30-4]